MVFRIKGMLDLQEKKIEDLNKIIEEDSLLVDKLQKTLLFYNEVLEKCTLRYLSSLSQLLTSVFQNIYQDFTKVVNLRIDESRGKKVIKVCIDRLYEGKMFSEELIESSGIELMLLGITLSIYFILLTGLPRIAIEYHPL